MSQQGSLFSDPWQSGAEWSPCRTYRYYLWRCWDPDRPSVNFLMLNPSTADATTNDPTVSRCQERARRWGYGGLIVTNLFALASTDPRQLYDHPEPIGPENDRAILRAAGSAGLVILAWGNHGSLHDRDKAVVARLAETGRQLHALKLTGHLQPAHPLYLSYDLIPERFDAAAFLKDVDSLLRL